MQLSCLATSPGDIDLDILLAIGFEDLLENSMIFHLVDDSLAAFLRRRIASEHFLAKAGERLTVLVDDRDRGPKRVLLIGAGPRSAFLPHHLRGHAAQLVREASTRGLRKCGVLFSGNEIASGDSLAAVRFLGEGAMLGAYRFDRYLSRERKQPNTVEEFAVVLGGLVPDQSLSGVAVVPEGAARAALRRAAIVARATCLTRDLVNEPASAMTPTALAEVARRLAQEHTLECTVLGPGECQEMGMGLLLGVARGSSEEPRFIHVVYRPEGYPAGDQASPTHAPAGDDGGRPPPRPRRVALVGKGVTFDSGGLSLKTTPQMLDMKADMAGAAAVLAAVGALADLRASCEVHAIAACVENMPSGHASRIGDVLRSLSGKTVEISNTDAEGRLLLGDALTYAARQEVDEIVDLATLTSACVVALGKETAGLMGSDPAAVERFAAAARMAGEDVWPLPLPQRLRETLKSEVADLKNTGDRFGGALVAGLFLREFVGATSWLHLDIAGPAVAEKAWGHLAQGGTGFGVATLIEYLAPSQPLPPGPQDS